MDYQSAALLLCPERLAGAFGHIPLLKGREFDAATMVGSWIKPGRYFNGCFRLRARDGRGDVVVGGFAMGAEKARRVYRHTPEGSACLVEPGLLLRLFPGDDRLPTLPSCLEGEVPEVLGWGGVPVTREVVSYRPGMRCQIRLSSARGVVFAKVCFEREPGALFERQARVFSLLCEAEGPITTPEPIAYVPSLALSLTRGAQGQSVYDLLRQGRLGAELVAVGRALCWFHQLRDSQFTRRHTPGDELRLVGEWVNLVESLGVAGAAHARERLDALASRLPAESADPAVVHRDFFDKQILIESDQLTLLDLDTACLGDPELDVANFIAHLEWRAAQYQLVPIDSRVAAFRSSYTGPLCEPRLTWYGEAARLRLACVYSLRPKWSRFATERMGLRRNQ